MAEEDRYMDMSDALLAAPAQNDLVSESQSKAAAAYRTAARLKLLANRRRDSALAFRQLSMLHFQSGRRFVSSKFEQDAAAADRAADNMDVHADEFLISAADHQEDAFDATPKESDKAEAEAPGQERPQEDKVSRPKAADKQEK
jgi:hypothetical protein